MREHDDEAVRPKAAPEGAGAPTPRDGEVDRARKMGGEVRPAGTPQPRRLDRAPGERFRQAGEATTPGDASGRAPSSFARRFGLALAAALATAIVTFALTTFDVGPGLLVVGLAGGWLTGLALAGGARAGAGSGPGPKRAAIAALLAAVGPTLGMLADALRAYTLHGVLLPWEYALARFDWVAPAAIALAAVAGAIRGR